MTDPASRGKDLAEYYCTEETDGPVEIETVIDAVVDLLHYASTFRSDGAEYVSRVSFNHYRAERATA